MATVEQTRAQVHRLLTSAMGLRVRQSGDAYCVEFTNASTSVRITVREWTCDREGQAQTLVVLQSLVLQAVPPSPALFEWVAREGGANYFGHIEVRDDRHEPGTLFLMMTHTLLGDYLDERELDTAMWGVLCAADSWDEALQRRFGGRRAKDSPRQSRG